MAGGVTALGEMETSRKPKVRLNESPSSIVEESRRPVDVDVFLITSIVVVIVDIVGVASVSPTVGVTVTLASKASTRGSNVFIMSASIKNKGKTNFE